MTTRKSIFFGTFLILAAGPAFGQSLSAGDGEIYFPTIGFPSTLLPVPRGDTTVIPIRMGLEYGTAASFILDAAPGREYRISFSARTTGACGEIAASFENDALFWTERSVWLDPNSAQTIACDSTGRAAFTLGVTITLPPQWRSSWSGMAIRCVAVDPVSGDSLAADAWIGIRYVLGVPYDLDGRLKRLTRGTTYILRPEFSTASLSPLRSGREEGSPSRLAVDGIPNEWVKVDWLLPTHAENDSGKQIPCSFSPGSGRFDETGELFDPNLPDTFRVSSCGTMTLDLGITVTVPPDALPGTYSCAVIGSASYIGNLNGPESRKVLEEELFFTVQIVGEEIPAEYALLQNFPNPFNPATTISYTLPKNARVRLSIVDLLGEEVARLVDEEKPAGLYRAVWDASGLPSGVYFYRLQTGSFTETRKLMLIR